MVVNPSLMDLQEPHHEWGKLKRSGHCDSPLQMEMDLFFLPVSSDFIEANTLNTDWIRKTSMKFSFPAKKD